MFNIKLEEDRGEDYQIVEIDYETPSIQIQDMKNNILYVSEYTTDANLLSYSSNGYPSFIK